MSSRISIRQSTEMDILPAGKLVTISGVDISEVVGFNELLEQGVSAGEDICKASELGLLGLLPAPSNDQLLLPIDGDARPHEIGVKVTPACVDLQDPDRGQPSLY